MAALDPGPAESTHPYAPAILPPMLGPAFAALTGSGLGWLAADRQLSMMLAVMAALLALALGFVASTRGVPESNLRIMRASFTMLCFFVCMAHAMTLVHRGHDVQERLAGGIHQVSGSVMGVVSAADPSGGDDWGRVTVRLTDGSIFQLSGAVGMLLPGQQITVQARFASPEGSRNPGGFDERLYLAKNGIFLKADLFLKRVTIDDGRTHPIGLGILRFRQALGRIARMALPQQEASLLLGMLMGDTSGMSREERAAFQAAGLSHLTAVSGANVSFLMMPTAFMLGRLLRRRRNRITALIGFVIGFAFLTGWEASVTRAILMVALALAGKLVRKRSDPLNALLFAATGMLMVRPLLILAFSFHLSFLATAGILLGQDRLLEWLRRWVPALPKPLQAILALNLSVQITVLPLQALATGILSPLSILANLAALPLAEGATLLGAGLMLIAALIMPIAYHLPALLQFLRLMSWPIGLLLRALLHLAAIFAGETWPRILTARLPVLGLVALFLLSGCLVITSSEWRRRLRIYASCLLIAGILLQYALPWLQPELEIWMLDVGQGDAMLIRARDGTVTLIDAGLPDAGVSVIRPAMTALGLHRLTQAVATHGHADHAGGLVPLMDAGLVDRLYLPQMALDLSGYRAGRAGVPEPASSAIGDLAARSGGFETDILAALLTQADRSHIAVQGVGKGDTIPIGSGARLTILAPERTDRSATTGSDPPDSVRSDADPAGSASHSAALRRRGANATSLIMRLETAAGNESMLLMGDCDQESEAELIRGGQNLAAGILRVAHHGSNATTGRPFLTAVNPRLALISVGRNDYGHPAAQLLARLDERSITTARTDRQGAVLVRLYGGRTTIHTQLSMPAGA